LNGRTDHQEEEQTIEMHPFCSHNLLVVPDIGDQLIHYELAPV